MAGWVDAVIQYSLPSFAGVSVGLAGSNGTPLIVEARVANTAKVGYRFWSLISFDINGNGVETGEKNDAQRRWPVSLVYGAGSTLVLVAAICRWADHDLHDTRIKSPVAKQGRKEVKRVTV
jgi:hypothetical protein